MHRHDLAPFLTTDQKVRAIDRACPHGPNWSRGYKGPVCFRSKKMPVPLLQGHPLGTSPHLATLGLQIQHQRLLHRRIPVRPCPVDPRVATDPPKQPGCSLARKEAL
eukprot:UN16022